MGKFNPNEIVFERPKTKFNPNEIVMDEEFSKDNNGFDISTARPIEDAKENSLDVGLASNIKPNNDKVLRSAKYGFEKSSSDVTAINQMLNAKYPNPEPYKKYTVGKRNIWMATGGNPLSVDNLGGVSEEFALKANQEAKKFAAIPTYEERRAYLQKEKIKNVEEKYSDLTK